MGIYTQALKDLAPDEFKRIEEEHLRLHNSINNLRNTCCNLENQNGCQSCISEQAATCQGRLVSSFRNIISVSNDHFEYEEIIMLHVGKITKEDLDFHDHQQAHRNILNELRATIEVCATLDALGDTAECYRQLYRRASELYEEHDRLFDDA